MKILKERETLQRIFGILQDNGVWRTKINAELYLLLKGPDMVTQKNKVGWHVQQIPEDRAVKEVFTTALGGRRGRRRPRRSWTDDMEKDLQMVVRR